MVLQLPDIIRAHPPVLPRHRVRLIPAHHIPAQQPIHQELHQKLLPLPLRHQPLPDRLLPAHQPRPQRMRHELNRLVFDIAERRPVQVPDHVRRHPKHPRDLQRRHLLVLNVRRRRGRNPHLLVRHPLLQDGHPVRVRQSPVVLLPALPDPPHRLPAQLPRETQNPARPRPVPEKLRPVLLHRQPLPHALPPRRHNRRIPHQPVRRQPPQVQHAPPRQLHRLPARQPVGVHQAIPRRLNLLHPVRPQRPQRRHLPPPVHLNLRVRVPPQQQMRLHRLAELQARHQRIRRVVQQPVQRMLPRPLLPSAVDAPVRNQRQARHRLRQHPHASKNGRVPQRALFAHRHPGRRTSPSHRQPLAPARRRRRPYPSSLQRRR